MAINLLPDELKPKSSTLKASKKLRKVSILMLSVFIIFGLVVGGVILVFTNLISISGRKQSTLQNEILTLQNTEARLLLIKDRLTKIQQLETEDVVDAKVTVLKGVIEQSGAIVDMNEFSISKDGITIKAAFANSSQLGQFFGSLQSNKEILSMRLDDIKYFPEIGYEVTLTI